MLYNRLIKKNPEKIEYLIEQLKANISDFESDPNDKTIKEIEKTNQKVLSLTSIDDLTFACYAYCLICKSNDSIINEVKIPDCFLRICDKMLIYPDLNRVEKADISRWCSYISWEFIQKKEFNNSLRVLQTGQKSDSSNNEIKIILPFAYLFNNQYDKAEKIIEEFKNKSLTAFENYKTYGEAYRNIIYYLEERAITHPDFAKVKELLKR